MLGFATPESEEGTERIFFRLLLPQDLHSREGLEPITSISLWVPHSSHSNSNRGIDDSLFSNHKKNDRFIARF